MKIGILLTGHAPDIVLGELGDYDTMFARLLAGHGFDYQAWAVVDGDFPPGPDAADGWLISGSKHGAYEDHDWIPPLEDFIRQVATSGRPMIGICFGHQIIAQALGGKVEKFGGGWSVGNTGYEIEGRHWRLNAWHQDQITELPPGARVIGHSDFCKYAALRYDAPILSVQPHPEFDATMVDRLIHYRAPGVVPQPLLDRANARLEDETDSAAFADRMAAFFKQEG